VSQQINLYNPALGPQRTLVSARNIAMATAASLAIVLASGSIADYRLKARKTEAQQASVQLKATQERVQQLVQQVANSKPDAAVQAELDKLNTQVESRAMVLSVLDKGLNVPGNGYAEMLRSLARQTLSGLWLTDIGIASGNGEMELKGRTLDRSLVAEYLTRLNSEKVFAGRSFAGLRIDQPAQEEATPGTVSRPVGYLEFFLTGSQDKSNNAGAIAPPASDEKAEKPAAQDVKEKKS